MFSSFIADVYKITEKGENSISGIAQENKIQRQNEKAEKAAKAVKDAEKKVAKAVKQAKKATKKSEAAAAKKAKKNGYSMMYDGDLSQQWKEFYAETGDEGYAAYELAIQVYLAPEGVDALVKASKGKADEKHIVDLAKFILAGAILEFEFDEGDVLNLERATDRLITAMLTHKQKFTEDFIQIYYEAVAAAKAVRKHSKRNVIEGFLDDADVLATEIAAKATPQEPVASKDEAQPQRAKRAKPQYPPVPEPTATPEATTVSPDVTPPVIDEAAAEAIAEEHQRATAEQLEALARGFGTSGRNNRGSRKARR